MQVTCAVGSDNQVILDAHAVSQFEFKRIIIAKNNHDLILATAKRNFFPLADGERTALSVITGHEIETRLSNRINVALRGSVVIGLIFNVAADVQAARHVKTAGFHLNAIL